MSALRRGLPKTARVLDLRRRHVERAAVAGMLLCVVVCLCGCGTVPEPRYYTLDRIASGGTSDAPTEVSHGSTDTLVLKVERLAVPDPYADRRIVFRPTGKEVGFWDFHMWAQPLDRMVTARVAGDLEKTGVFGKIDSFPYTWEKPDLVLRGVILAFEEIDRDDGWYGRVKLFLEMADSATGDVIWSGKLDVEKKADRKAPVAVVEALSLALDEAVARAVSGMKTVL